MAFAQSPTRSDYTTGPLPPEQQTAGWTEIVGRAYFPLELDYQTHARFDGSLSAWSLGDVEASRLRSDAAMYRRRHTHLEGATEEEFLLTVPRVSPVRFLQMGRELVCTPGGFIVERGNEPYEFSYGAPNDLIVAKIGYRQLAARLPDPGRFCAIRFDATSGVGALLVSVLQSTEACEADITGSARVSVGQQIVDLLALAIEQDPRADTSAETSVRRAHLTRISAETTRHMADPNVTPARIAAACGISTRYLHDLCSRDGPSWRDRLREARLLAAHRRLTRPEDSASITEIAYASGFADASSFSRTYRARFRESPRATRATSMALRTP